MPMKQVIVMRKDLGMRKGKMIAQGAHAAIGALKFAWACGNFADAADVWLQTGATKICVSVNSEKDLLDIYGLAVDARLPVYLVTDSGRTEFHDVHTHTCVAIGPAPIDEIDAITKDLKLL